MGNARSDVIRDAVRKRRTYSKQRRADRRSSRRRNWLGFQ